MEDNTQLLIDCTYADFIDLDIQEEIKSFMDTAKEQYNIDVEIIDKSNKRKWKKYIHVSCK